jgi:hypothetical protein
MKDPTTRFQDLVEGVGILSKTQSIVLAVPLLLPGRRGARAPRSSSPPLCLFLPRCRWFPGLAYLCSHVVSRRRRVRVLAQVAEFHTESCAPVRRLARGGA